MKIVLSVFVAHRGIFNDVKVQQHFRFYPTELYGIMKIVLRGFVPPEHNFYTTFFFKTNGLVALAVVEPGEVVPAESVVPVCCTVVTVPSSDVTCPVLLL